MGTNGGLAVVLLKPSVRQRRPPMQTRVQSLLEVSLDYVVSILVNIVGQLVFYPAQATTARVTFFSGIFLPLAFGRRWCIRRLFEGWTPRDHQQPRWLSALEVVS